MDQRATSAGPCRKEARCVSTLVRRRCVSAPARIAGPAAPVEWGCGNPRAGNRVPESTSVGECAPEPGSVGNRSPESGGVGNRAPKSGSVGKRRAGIGERRCRWLEFPVKTDAVRASLHRNPAPAVRSARENGTAGTDTPGFRCAITDAPQFRRARWVGAATRFPATRFPSPRLIRDLSAQPPADLWRRARPKCVIVIEPRPHGARDSRGGPVCHGTRLHTFE